MYNKAENGKNPNKVQNRPQKKHSTVPFVMLWKCYSEVLGKLFGINTISDFEEWCCVQHQNNQAILFL